MNLHFSVYVMTGVFSNFPSLEIYIGMRVGPVDERTDERTCLDVTQQQHLRTDEDKNKFCMC